MKDFNGVLRNWYLKNRRELPWRDTTDPYPIWLSEIMLQQTRVEQGLPYWVRFTTTFPNITDLAKAPEEQIMRMWQGLGYYSRARNLHTAAKQVSTEFKGKFPANYKDIRSLKGIGDYTAAAIASFSFNLPHAVVDGNVYRFLSRLFGIETPIDSTEGKKIFAELAEKLLDKKEPGLHNQAIMEFGAMQCKPSNPNCEACPFAIECIALKNKQVNVLPVKSKKTKVRDRHFHFIIIHDGTKTIVSKRVLKDIWQGLYQFPLIEIESKKNLKPGEVVSFAKEVAGIEDLTLIKKSAQIKHLLSHQTLHCYFWWIGYDKLNKKKASLGYEVVNINHLDNIGMPQLIVKYLSENEFID
ncbi:MAG TPA: A/G-specific adenine glycosylase [Bacteroidia bacterium]|jgi:A/G-specific adenine glycosylase|nr:A/G-specific adenine glycosylase [Bacteroidia bacterium]HQF27540.1 A/G-specific adenine glycosylase [Bacteroidia bacterium]HQK98653.1 A/G-specific adenine glycosylase [Bacteroidia bacterium]